MNINDKISVIIDVDNLFNLNNSAVQDMINGDSYRINELYEKNLNNFRNNLNYQFTHIILNKNKSLNEWIKYYQCDINNDKSIMIFLRLAVPIFV